MPRRKGPHPKAEIAGKVRQEGVTVLLRPLHGRRVDAPRLDQEPMTPRQGLEGETRRRQRLGTRHLPAAELTEPREFQQERSSRTLDQVFAPLVLSIHGRPLGLVLVPVPAPSAARDVEETAFGISGHVPHPGGEAALAPRIRPDEGLEARDAARHPGPEAATILVRHGARRVGVAREQNEAVECRSTLDEPIGHGREGTARQAGSLVHDRPGLACILLEFREHSRTWPRLA